MNYNKVIQVGRLTKDPQVRVLDSGMAVCNFMIANSRTYKGKEESLFVGVTAWGKTAELIGKYCRKGSPVLIEGRLKYDNWEKDGAKQSRIAIVCENVQFLGKKAEPKTDGDIPGQKTFDDPVPDFEPPF